MRRMLVSKFFFILKLGPDKVFNRRVLASNYPIMIWLSNIIAQTVRIEIYYTFSSSDEDQES